MKSSLLIGFSMIALLLLSNSCGRESRIKERLTGLYAVNFIEIDGKKRTDISNNILSLDDDLTCTVPKLYDNRYEPMEKSEGNWDIEIDGETTYMIIKGTRFEGRYELSYDLKSGKIALRSKNISIWAQRAL